MVSFADLLRPDRSVGLPPFMPAVFLDAVSGTLLSSGARQDAAGAEHSALTRTRPPTTKTATPMTGEAPQTSEPPRQGLLDTNILVLRR